MTMAETDPTQNAGNQGPHCLGSRRSEGTAAHPKTNCEIMYMMVKPLLVAPFMTVSMTAPMIMMQAVVMEPLLRPILSPMAPSRHIPRMMPASARVRCQHHVCREGHAGCRPECPSPADV